MKILLSTILLIFNTSVLAEKIQYEIYEKATGTLVGSGIKEYEKKDIILNPYESRGEKVIEKFIELEQDFKIGARIFSEPKLKGFGLIAELNEGDFSWEWYNQKEGYKFQKLQGNKGFVQVRVSGLPSLEILEEVIFLDDAHLSFHHGGAGTPESHDIIIKKGSVLKFD